MFLGSGGNNNIRSRVEINDYESAFLRQTFQSDVTIQSAFHLLFNTLFERGMIVIPKDGPYNIDKPAPPIINFLYNKYVLPFLKDALQSFIIYGYVTGTMVTTPIMELDNKLFSYPVFVPPERLNKARITLRNWQTVWEVVERQFIRTNIINVAQPVYLQEVKNSEYFIAFYDGYEPDIHTGLHRSPVKIIQSDSEYIRQLQKFHVLGTIQRARPSFVVAHSAEKGKHEGTLSTLENSHPDLFYKDQAIKQHNEQRRSDNLAKEDFKYGQGKTLLTSAYGDVMTYRPTVYDERLELRQGLEVSSTQPTMPEVQPDLLEHLAAYREIVAFTIGVPYTLLSASNRTGQAGKMSAEDVEVLQTTLGNMKKQLCDLAERLYVRQFPDLKGQSDLHFDLLYTPSVSPDNIQKMVDRNVISTEMGNQFIAATMGISPIHVIDKPNERITIPVGGNEHQTGPRLSKEDARIEAETKVFLADADAKRAQAEKLRAEAKAVRAETSGDSSEGELLNKEMEMKEKEIEGKLKVMEMQIEVDEIKTKNAIDRMVAQKKNAVKPSSSS